MYYVEGSHEDTVDVFGYGDEEDVDTMPVEDCPFRSPCGYCSEWGRECPRQRGKRMYSDWIEEREQND